MSEDIKALQHQVEALNAVVESLDNRVDINANYVEDFMRTTNERLILQGRKLRNLQDEVDDINDVIDNGTLSAEDVQIKNMVIDNDKISFSLKGTDPVKPEHYRKGEIDLFESWYLKHSFEEFRAIMQSHAEKYIYRNKNNRVEDLEEAIYVLERLKEKEALKDKKG